MLEVGKVTNDNIFGTKMGKLGANQGNGIKYTCQPVLIRGQKVGKQQNRRDKAQRYSKVRDDGVLYALSYYDAQGG